MQTVIQGTTCYVSASFLDKARAPAVPSSVSYRIDCLTSKRRIKEGTVSPAATVEIQILAADNEIQDEGNRTEIRRVTITASYGAGDAVQNFYDYELQRLGA